MRLVLTVATVAAAACGGRSTPAPAPAPAAPSVSTTNTDKGRHIETRCELTAEAVRCASTNLGGDATVECVEPFLGVKDTGEILNGRRRWCSAAIAPGATEHFVALEGVRPVDHCGPALDGCVLTMFAGPGDTIAQIAAFARALEAAASHPGGKQPTMKECDDARRAWLASPELAEKYRSMQLEDADLVGVFCKLHVPREQVQCFATARNERDVEACVPD
ncbi:MAG TPA: hypothetical protein VM261_06815 [Kofleriaceae bacterium]|nr:hypothetical protein [Kofleriaceae bacterium]